MAVDLPIRRCAIYTRKSTEEGLDMDFNSLQAQRESCEAYIKSQRGEGWKLIPTAYDDGGISGGTMVRPALQRLMFDIESGSIDVVVVYKVDRLTRSLHDFSKMVEVFDRKGVSFVAVTQQFNTTSSMGRLTLNVLLSFAQFEREVTGERIRDKIAASIKKGIWMGGGLPRGYRVEDRKLIVVPEDAEQVRTIFRMYLDLPSVRELALALRKMGVKSHGTPGRPSAYMSRGALHNLLKSPIYIGMLHHRGTLYAGQHEAIVDKDIWDEVQAKLKANLKCNGRPHRKTEDSPLIGKLFDERGGRLTPSHTVKQGRRYRYYESHSDDRDDKHYNGLAIETWRLPAMEIEKKVSEIVGLMLADRSAIANAALEANNETHAIESLFQNSVTQNMSQRLEHVSRVQLYPDRIAVTIELLGTPPIKLERVVEMTLKRRGRERRIVIQVQAKKYQHADKQIVKALSLGMRYWEQLNSDDPKSAMEFAKSEDVDNSNVGRALPLVFMSPVLIEMLISGKQAESLTAKNLLRQQDMPLSWFEQRRYLG